MTARERYRAIMHHENGTQTLRWEFGYWVSTLDRWYREGLPRDSESALPGDWQSGDTVFGEGLPFSSRIHIVGYKDRDVHGRLRFDDGSVGIPLNWRACPLFVEATLQEEETSIVMTNMYGIKVRLKKAHDTLPQQLDWPVHDRTSWEKIEEERFGQDILARFPSEWEKLAKSHRDRDYPLGLLMDGFFSAPRELMGLVRQSTMYYDDPKLMHEINRRLANTWLRMLEEVVSKIQLDFVYIWEDMCYKNGPLLSPRMFAEFVAPYYHRVTSFLKEHGVDIIFVDTDGDCRLLIPEFLKAGVTGLYPFEVQAGMDIVHVRKQYPGLLIQGGLDKNKVAEGKKAIDAELETKLPFMLSQGGYIPYCDHLVPPTVSWENFAYYRQKVGEYIDQYQEHWQES